MKLKQKLDIVFPNSVPFQVVLFIVTSFESSPGGEPLQDRHILDDGAELLRESFSQFLGGCAESHCEPPAVKSSINSAISNLEAKIGRMPLRELEVVQILIRSADAQGKPIEPLISNYLLASDFVDLRDPWSASSLRPSWHSLLLAMECSGEDMADICYDHAEIFVESKLDAHAFAKILDFERSAIELGIPIAEVKADALSLIHFEESYSEFADVIREIVNQRLTHSSPLLAAYRPALEICFSIGSRVIDLLQEYDQRQWRVPALLESVSRFVEVTGKARVFRERERYELLLEKILDIYRAKQREPTAAIAAVSMVGSANSLEAFNELLAPIFKQGRGFGIVTPRFLGLVPKIEELNLWEQIIRIGDAYERLYPYLYPKDVCQITNRLAGHIESVIALDPKLLPRIASLLETEIFGPDIFDYHLRELKAEALMPTLLFGKDKTEITDAVSSFQSIAINDHVPFDERDPRAAQVRKETFAIARRIWDLYVGFGALTFEGMRRGERLASLAEFGLDSASSVHAIRGDNKEHAPGRGYLISFLSKDNLFARSPSVKGDPHQDLKLSMPWAARELDDIELSRYFFMRQGLGVIPPQVPKYEINGVHYSFIAWNDHFHNSWCDRAFLVPTEILLEQLRGSLSSLGEELSGSIDAAVDINLSYLNPRGLEMICQERKLSLLDVGSGSVLGGGMCNAFPVRSAPYFSWEDNSYLYVTKDIWGHSHKSYMLRGTYQRKMDQNLDRALEPLREAHVLVRDVTNRCLNLLSWFQLGNAFWRKGQTVPYKKDGLSEGGSGGQRSEANNIPLPTPELTKEESPGAFRPTPYSNRMLMQAYDWHHVFSQRGAERKDFPVLGSISALRYSVQPKQILLDTHDLTIWDGKRWWQLPPWSDGSGPEEIEIWNERILSKLGALDDLRWYRREAFRKEIK